MPGRQAGEHEQGERQRPAGQPVAAQQPAGALQRPGTDDRDRREGDERGHGVDEHVGRRGPHARPRVSAATGSTTQPACATVDQASRRVESSWRSAMTLPSSIDAAASVPSTTLTDPVSTAAPAKAWATTSSAATAEIFEAAASAAAVPRSAVE